MASLNLNPKLRPCYVDGKKALFHCWFNVSQIVEPSFLVGGHNGGVLYDILGLVEDENGHMMKVYPRDIQFLDTGNLFYENSIFFRSEKGEE